MVTAFLTALKKLKHFVTQQRHLVNTFDRDKILF